MTNRRPNRIWISLCALVPMAGTLIFGLTIHAKGTGKQSWVQAGTARFEFDEALLAQFGLTAIGRADSVQNPGGPSLDAIILPASTLRIESADGLNQVSGRIESRGAVAFLHAEKRLTVGNFSLESLADGTWAIRSGLSDDVVMFRTQSSLQDAAVAGQMRIAAELIATETFAEKLGVSELAGETVGRLTIEARLSREAIRFEDTLSPGPTLPSSGTTAGTIGPDVIVGSLHEIGNYGSSGGIAAFSVGTISCNIGDFWLNWFDDTNQHPTIGMNMFRLKNGRFEQIGISWLKHGFFALSENLCFSNCQSTNGEHLGVHCSDPYSASLNGSQSNLGPRYQVNASTGFFPYPPASPPFSGNIARRMQVAQADIDNAQSGGGLYYVEGQYISPDDAAAGNQNNNASWRPVTVSGSGNSWSLNLTGTTHRQEPAIKAWKAQDSQVVETNIQVPNDGLFILAAKATNLGNSFWHYEYAVQNLNSHRSARAFSIPVDPSATVQNIGFHDVNYHSGEPFSGTDWTSTVSNGAVTWFTQDFNTNQNANALRWGTLYNFRFDVNRQPQTVNATLELFRFGTPGVMNPSTVGPIPSDTDCNNNDIPDPIDIANGTSNDCDGDGKPDECQVYGIQAAEIVTGLDRPVYLSAPDGDTARLFIAERAGRIKVFRDGQVQPTLYLDISSLVDSSAGKGLQTFAFDPEYPSNGFVYFYYTSQSGNAVLARYTVTANPEVANGGSALVLMTIPLQGSNHFGGQLQFGPDGYLYVGTGDSGGSGDSSNKAQDSGSLLGKILRLDVHAPPPYVPETNPFVNPGLPLDEIWALGLRDPAHFGFDRETGELYIADRGNAVEEINIQPDESLGGQNYGWRCMQGTACTGLSGCTCSGPALTNPVLSYSHSGQGCGGMIIGGFPYRGCLLPTMLGTYFYADSCTNEIHSFRYVNGQVTEHVDQTAALSLPGGPIQQVVSFGEDAKGEIYLISDAGGIYRISRSAFCGNNVLEPGEQCDDGDGETGDGCDANCRFEVGPPNDSCINAQSVAEGRFGFNTNDATTDGPNEFAVCSVSQAQNPLGSDIWFCYTPTCTGIATLTTCSAASFDTMIGVYSTCSCPSAPSADECVNDSCGQQTTLTFPVTACESTLIRVGGFNNAVGAGTLTITCAPQAPGVDCDNNGVDDGADIACGTHSDNNDNSLPDICEATGDRLRGGRLYDTWWDELGVGEPAADHALWQYRPDQTSNASTGGATWRCTECHGWDYTGASGQYGAGPHHTGFPGIRGTSLGATEMFDLLKLPASNGGGGGVLNGHNLGSVMSDSTINDLVAFVLIGTLDANSYIHPTTGVFLGDPTQGGSNYSVGGTQTHCINCHGPSGTNINFGTPSEPRYLGTTANDDPWRFLHRARVGFPGTSMVSWLTAGGDDQGAADIGRYVQLNFPTECIADGQCDDGASCTLDTCSPTGQCINDADAGLCVDDLVFCNGPEVCDPETGCASSGNPCGDPAQCDESANSCGCLTPIVIAAGNRYLVVAPQAKNSTVKVTLLVEPLCPGGVARYVGPPSGPNNVAVLVDDRSQAAELTLSQWGSPVYISGIDVAPSVTYTVRADCGSPGRPTLTDPAQITTDLWGDVAARLGGPTADGRVDIADVAALVDGFKEVPGSLPLYRLDLYGCVPNQRIDITDIAGGVDAFRGRSYQSSLCPGPCW